MLDTKRSVSPDFLAGGGEMGALMRAHDWQSSPVGAPESWPQSLRTGVRLLLNTQHPMIIWWGNELIQFYNDAYSQTMGPERHPGSLGQGARDCWAEIWDIIGPHIEQVMSGRGSTWNEDQLVPVTRHGRLEDSLFAVTSPASIWQEKHYALARSNCARQIARCALNAKTFIPQISN